MRPKFKRIAAKKWQIMHFKKKETVFLASGIFRVPKMIIYDILFGKCG